MTITENPTSTTQDDFEAQFSQLINKTDDLRSRLHDIRSAAIPHSVYSGITSISDELENLQKQVNTLVEEKQRYKVLAQIGQVINSSLDVDVVLQIAMDTMIRLTGAERGFLMLRDDHKNLTIRTARNWEQEMVEEAEYAVSRTIVNKVVAEGKPILTTNAQEDPRFRDQESIVALNLRSIMCVPLKLKGEVNGVIYADNRIRSGLFTVADLDLLSSFANHAAVSLENAHLFASVRQSLSEVTELKNLMDNVLDSITSGVITLSMEKVVTVCNRAAERLLNTRASDIVGYPLSEVLPVISEGIDTYVDNVIRSNLRLTSVEKSIHIPSRGEIDFRLHLSPLKDLNQETRGVVVVLETLPRV